MTYSDKKQILDYIFSNNDIPAHIMDEFSRWLIANSSDTETESIMLEKWEEHSSAVFEEDDLKGLQELRAIISRKQSVRKVRTTVMKTVCAAAISFVIFCAGYTAADRLNPPARETTLVTAEGNIGEFILPDGTKVWLNGNSRLTYPEEFEKDKRNVRLVGEGFFEVRKNPRAPFVLTMPNISVEVLGTSFGASCYEGASCEEIVLKSGSVKVSGSTISEDIILKPDQQLTYSPFNGDMKIAAVDAGASYRWYEKYLSFDNARLGDILANIGRRYRMEIKVHTSVSSDKRLSLTIINESVEDIMDIISTLLPIRYEIINDCLIIEDKY